MVVGTLEVDYTLAVVDYTLSVAGYTVSVAGCTAAVASCTVAAVDPGGVVSVVFVDENAVPVVWDTVPVAD